MTNIIYRSVISGIGEFAVEVLADGMLITFKEGGPADLADYCFTHSHGELIADLAAGQIIKLGELSYVITAVGEVATTNFRELGHITLRFDGKDTPELPGTVHVNGQVPKQLSVGDTILVVTN